jgi:hypothetical protein
MTAVSIKKRTRREDSSFRLSTKQEAKYLESTICQDDETTCATPQTWTWSGVAQSHSICRHNTTKQEAGTNEAQNLPWFDAYQ